MNWPARPHLRLAGRGLGCSFLHFLAEVEAIEIRSALAGLKHFRLADASCFSEDDRRAILSLIGKWWTDTSSGENDPERLRQLGFHRFERFVRHSLAPQLSGGRREIGRQ